MNTTTAMRFDYQATHEQVLCLHSSTASGRQWMPFGDRLGTRYVVEAPDLYGYGTAPEVPDPATFALDDEVARIAPLIERAPAGVHLVGHSYGGAVALRAALRYRDRVASVAVYEPVLFRLLFQHSRNSEATREIWSTQHDVRRRLAAGNVASAAQRFIDYWSGPDSWARLPANVQDAVMRRMGKVTLDFDALFGDTSTLDEFATLEMPVLCMYGSRAPLSTRRIARLLGGRLPNVELVRMEGLDHMAPITAPRRVHDRLMAFLDAQPPRAVLDDEAADGRAWKEA